MKKELTICFRTTKDNKKSLEQIAKKSRKSVSSVINNIIYNYLGENKSPNALPKEQREFPRKKVQLPALFYNGNTQSGNIKTLCTVLDISLGGVLISAPLGSKLEITKNDLGKNFNVILSLPESLQPIDMTCRLQRIHEYEKDVQIGVDFVDTNFQSCQILQKYLI
ncbi:MAG: PilZ domain-containing protein [Syntrophales bacterium]|jgi:c-di-GMP-binding flagellar brake protein YcgR